MPENRRIARAAEVLQPGSRVAFTGLIIVGGRPLLDASSLKSLCEEHGLVHEDHVSRDTTALIAEDVNTRSRFAQLAHLYNTPFVAASDFSEWVSLRDNKHVSSPPGPIVVTPESETDTPSRITPASPIPRVEESVAKAEQELRGPEPAAFSSLNDIRSEQRLDLGDATSGENTKETSPEQTKRDFTNPASKASASDRTPEETSAVQDAAGTSFRRVLRRQVDPSDDLNTIILGGKKFSIDIQEASPAAIAQAKRASIFTSEDDLLLELIKEPQSLFVRKKTAKGQGQKMMWALVLSIVFFVSFGLSGGDGFFGNLFAALLLLHLVLAVYHFCHMVFRLIKGPKFDIEGTKSTLERQLSTPLSEIAVHYTDEYPLNKDEYSLVAQLCGFYNFLQDVEAPISSAKWREIIEEALFALRKGQSDGIAKAAEVAETINLWLDKAAAQDISSSKFAKRDIELIEAR